MKKIDGLIPITETTALPDQGGARQPRNKILFTIPDQAPSPKVTDTASRPTFGGNSTVNRDRRALLILKEFPVEDR